MKKTALNLALRCLLISGLSLSQIVWRPLSKVQNWKSEIILLSKVVWCSKALSWVIDPKEGGGILLANTEPAPSCHPSVYYCPALCTTLSFFFILCPTRSWYTILSPNVTALLVAVYTHCVFFQCTTTVFLHTLAHSVFCVVLGCVPLDCAG